ncbi:MAG: glycosyltransferase family 25 protein, partial [Euryarchaeota archaeon]|nr:glycosyltransferase family 25 protein [Euryarchaeota archaeon]
MKVKVINLEWREDRRQQFIENNAQLLPEVEFVSAYDGSKITHQSLLKDNWDTNKDWRDPILGRVLTKGEIGCFISHYRLWEQCAVEGVPYLILEDDVVFDKKLEFPPSEGEFDILYLCYSEQLPNAVQKLDENYVIPAYPYWLAAYVISPVAAQKLISTDIHRNIIPCDEYVPQMIAKGELQAVAVAEPFCYQRKREEAGTNIEPLNEADYIRDFETHVLTVGSDSEKMSKLLDSASHHNISVENICGPAWNGTDMSGPGGGQKLVDLRYWLVANEIPDHDVVLFTDAYDVFYGMGLEAILGRFLGFKSEIVFSAEQYLWPDNSLRFPPTHTKYMYLNSGTFIGRVGEIKRLLANPIKPEEDDQLYLQKQYLSGHFDITLDVEHYIFATHEEQTEIRNKMIYNPLTECFSCIYHGNGGGDAKRKFNQLYEDLYPKPAYLEVRDYKVLANEMLLIKCFTEEDCKR